MANKTLNLFVATERPALDLFYTRDDPNDPRLGDVVAHDTAGYEDAQVVILGCPQDEGVRRNRGRPGAALAPAAIRQALYRLTPLGLEGLRIFDLGDTHLADSLEATHEAHAAVVRQILEDGKRLIVLGGGNDISYPDCSALAQVAGPVLTFNIDAHFDVRADSPRNSGTPYRQLLDEGHIEGERFFEIGYQPQANSPIYHDYLLEKGAHLYSLDLLREIGVTTPVRRALADSRAQAIFWGFDMDVVRAADAPGVSAPGPVGISADDLIDLALLAGNDKRTRLVEFTEVNPLHDLDGHTARLAAIAVHRCLSGFAPRQSR